MDGSSTNCCMWPVLAGRGVALGHLKVVGALLPSTKVVCCRRCTGAGCCAPGGVHCPFAMTVAMAGALRWRLRARPRSFGGFRTCDLGGEGLDRLVVHAVLGCINLVVLPQAYTCTN